MGDILVLRARLRKRDKDIQQAVKRLNLEEGELADMVRDGLRLRLNEIGAMRPPTPAITPNDARSIARELMNNLKERGENYANQTERDRRGQGPTQVSLFAPQR